MRPMLQILFHIWVHCQAMRPDVAASDLNLDLDSRLATQFHAQTSALDLSSQELVDERLEAQKADTLQKGIEDCSSAETVRSILETLRCPGDLTGSDFCTWPGIVCKGCYVVKVECKQADGRLPRDLHRLSHLQQLQLESTQVTGDIQAVQNLTRLQRLNIAFTRVTGDIEVFKSTPQLRVLKLQSTSVTGDIQAFRSTPRLQQMFLYFTGITGDIEAFKNTSDLVYLDLAATGTTGDIAVFGGTPFLQGLVLYSTNVIGDIKVFQETPSLSHLELWPTKVTGDLKVFEYTPNLWHVVLYSTGVAGDIHVFEEKTYLEELQLGNTGAYGDIQVFQDVPRLQTLNLRSTNVTGDMHQIRLWRDVKTVDLSKTLVSGRIDRAWRGCCQSLQRLNLAESKVSFLPTGNDALELMKVSSSDLDGFLPALTSLDVSRCLLHGELQQLIQPLMECKFLSKIAAAGCNLTGELVPTSIFYKDGSPRYYKYASLWSSLVSLDISANTIKRVGGLPISIVSIDLSNMSSELVMDHGILAALVNQRVRANLRMTVLKGDEPKQLIQKGLLKATERWVTSGLGYSCHNLVGSTMDVTPERFAPELLCGCARGYSGHGTTCLACEANFFNPELNQSQCQRCPPNSRSDAGSPSLQSCQCSMGNPYNGSRGLTCACGDGDALLGDDCVSCEKLNLKCMGHGNSAATAPPAASFMRLRPNASDVFQCVDPAAVRCPENVSMSGCAPGYDGPLCVLCAQGFQPRGKTCQPCANSQTPYLLWFGLLGLGDIFLAAAYAYRRRGDLHRVQETGAAAVLMQLLSAQAPMMLQLVQLWVVLSCLAKEGLDTEVKKGQGSFTSHFPEVAYLETLELTVDSWQEWFNIQCFFDPVVIHSASALAAPLLPLLLLGLCAMIELFSRSDGINLALKMLTLFFIGGASSSAKLLNCQDYDGGGEKSLGEDSFRPLFPHLKCNDSNGLALWVDGIGYATVFAYGMVIPMFLLMVMARQHLALQESRLLVATADIGKHTRALRIERLRRTSEETPEPTTELGAGLKDDVLARRLLAAAAVHMAVEMRGSKVQVELKKDLAMVTVTPLNAASDEDQADSAVDVSEMLASMVVVQENLAALRSRTVMQMLTERSMLQDEVSDRVVLGAKQLLTKYAMCQHVWMEVALKLVAVALVSVVSADIGVTGLYLALALTLGMAAVIAMVHPYSQPQLNDVQCLCFVSLALSAAGFHYGVPWISRLGLGAPFLLLSVQVFKPDSVEALALRLYEELKHQSTALQRGQPAVVSVSLRKFF
ncbi:unnamed protein product [Durusdinium trenchii]|uniref:Tyrosine-protein kinase ephrin type A/B receptor-like domain-containing protein n=1 Tax=Durusdinium trenchii TaxID=1381693 RepID=A0ABP0N9C8_9DINO